MKKVLEEGLGNKFKLIISQENKVSPANAIISSDFLIFNFESNRTIFVILNDLVNLNLLSRPSATALSIFSSVKVTTK